MDNQNQRNARLGVSLLALTVGMLLLAYASVPLYQIFCKATGFGGTPKVAEKPSERTVNRTITIRFNSDTDRNLDWRFTPEQREISVKIGENSLTMFTAENLSNESIVGMARYNITPEKASPYFVKVKCFCFEAQRIGPHQKKEFPVSFYIDPGILEDRSTRDVETITLSYTFFKYANQNIDKKLAN